MVEPQSGKVVREFDFGRRGPTVNAATPLVDGSDLFVTAAYGIGCRKVDMSDRASRPICGQSHVISSQYASPVRVGDWLVFDLRPRRSGRRRAGCVNWNDGPSPWSGPLMARPT